MKKTTKSLRISVLVTVGVLIFSPLLTQGILISDFFDDVSEWNNNNEWEEILPETNELFQFDGVFVTGNKQVAPLSSVLKRAGIQGNLYSEASDANVLVDGSYVSMIIGGYNKYFSSNLLLEHLMYSENVIVKEKLAKINAIVVDVPINNLDLFIEKCQILQSVSYIEPNYVMSVEGTPNDPNWGIQWGPERIEADRAWSIESGSGSSVLVAVIDTGIDYNHPDLSLQYVPIGYDFENNDNDPMDDHNHGSHCAGIITATINNSIGIAGVANVSVMAVKTFDAGGYGTVDNAAQSIVYAVDNGATVLSNSYGFPAAQVLHDACIYAKDNDVMVVASAGNSASSNPNYPAAYPEVISVSATDINDNLAGFSSYGSTIELSAPGVDVYSCYRVSVGSYGYMSGTSMSGPHVAAVAALIRAAFPSWNFDQVRNRMQTAVDDLGDPGWDQYFGYGLVNAYQAVLPPQPHDLNAKLYMPTNVELDINQEINVSISNYGLNDETNIFAQLFIDENEVANQIFANLNVGESETFSYVWNPSVTRIYNVTAYVTPVPGETFLENNIDQLNVTVSELSNYIMNDNAHYSWIDATSGTVLPLSDDDSEAVLLPFSFQFYDQTFDTLYVSSNGWMSFANTNPSSLSNIDFPSTDPYLYYSIALYWDDLFPSGNVYAYSDSDKVVIEYLTINNYGGGTAGTFELVLYRNGDILFQYDYLSSINSPSIGLNYGLNPAYYNAYHGFSSSTDDLAILFTNVVPDHDLSCGLELPLYPSKDEEVTINASVYNNGINDESNVELQLWIDESLVASQVYPDLLIGETQTIQYSWTPTTIKTYNITAYVIPVTGETHQLNNKVTQMVAVVDPNNRIGFIYTHGERNMDALRVHYETTGYVVDDIFTTITESLLSAYEYIFVGEGGSIWLASEVIVMENFIAGGGIFVGIGDSSPANGVLQIAANNGITFTGTSTGLSGRSTFIESSHPLMEGVTAVHIPSAFNALALSGNAEPLFWDASGVEILGATVNISQGQFCVLSDDFESAVYEEDNEVMFDNILHWKEQTIIELIYPNGGERLEGEELITWNVLNPEDAELNSTLYYWDYDAQIWILIVTSIINDTYYLWDTTLVAEGVHYQIKVEVFNGTHTISDISDGTFIVDNINESPEIALLAPNGGEILNGSILITWSASDPDLEELNYALYYWDSSSWTLIISGLTETYYYWDSTTVSDGYYRIRVEVTDGMLTATDQSNSDFEINNLDPPTIIIDNIPNIVSGEVLITWTTYDNDYGFLYYAIFYRVGSNPLIYLGDVYDDTFYLFDTTLVADALEYQIYIEVFDGYYVRNDYSNRFIINNINQAPSVNLLTPMGGETIIGNVTIDWYGNDPDGDTLYYSIYIRSESNWIQIVGNLTNTIYIWDSTEVDNGDYDLKIEVSDGTLTDDSQTSSPITIKNKTKRVGMPIFGTVLIALGALSSIIIVTLRSKRKRK